MSDWSAVVCSSDLIRAMLAEETIPPDREADPGDPRYLAAFDAIEADPNQRLIAAELDGRVVGTMQLSLLPGLSFVGSWRGLIEAVRIVRSEERRVGKECGSTCRSRWSPYH